MARGAAPVRSPQIRTRTLTAQPRHLPCVLNPGHRRVVPPCPDARPCMAFLFVGSQSCAPASFRRSVALPPLPSASTWATLLATGFTYRGLAPHQFAPMLGVHQRMQATEGSRA